MKAITVIGIVLSIVMMVVGIFYPIPEKHIYNFSGHGDKWTDKWGNEYVGGDAYNYQIEASLKAGWVSGLMSMKAIFTVGGAILLVFTLVSNKKHSELKKQTQLLMAQIPQSFQPQNTQFSPQSSTVDIQKSNAVYSNPNNLNK